MLSAGIGTLLWTAIAFLIVLFLLKKLAWKPILAALQEREDFIDKSLKSAEQAKAQMSDLKSENEKLLAEARLEREKILKEAREMKDTIISEAKTVASEEGNRLVANAKEEISKEKANAMSDIKKQVAALSLDIAEKIIRKEFDDKTQQEALVNEHLNSAKLS
jgi:F-type H+-transporting ATPase subunit b